MLWFVAHLATNGMLENAARRVIGMMRGLGSVFERRLEVVPESAAMTWAARHSVELMVLYIANEGGKSPLQRARGQGMSR